MIRGRLFLALLAFSMAGGVKAQITQPALPAQQIMIKFLLTEVAHDDSPQAGSFFALLNSEPDRLSSRHTPGPVDGSWQLTIPSPELMSSFQKLAESGKAEVLSRPYVLATENVPSRISVPINDHQRDPNMSQDESCLIDLIPHSDQQTIILDLSMHLHQPGEPVPAAPVVDPAVFGTAMSRVMLDQGQSVILHGFAHQRETTTIAKIPIAGDIPLLGALFTGQKTTKTNVELVVMITATLAKPVSR